MTSTKAIPSNPHKAWIEVLVGENTFDRNFRSGILHYAKEHGFQRVQVPPWEEFHDAFRRGHFESGNLAIIGHERDPQVLRSVEELGIPCVLAGSDDGLRGQSLSHGHCIVCSTDHTAIGRMAAEYLFGQGRFATYAFAASAGADIDWWIAPRREAFQKALASHGIKRVHEFSEAPGGRSPERIAEDFRVWADPLPHPLAIFACNDEVAREVVTQCDIAGYRVPEEISVLGVDNNVPFCETAPVAISSIELETARLGREAMSLVERMLAGEDLSGRTVLCPPSHVVERRSTSLTPVQDTFVARAVDFISANAEHNIGVTDVVNACGTSRRFLEQRVKSLTGRTILETIHEKRLGFVLNLLRNTNWPLGVIADRTEFTSLSGLCSLFKRRYGCSMRTFRNDHAVMVSPKRLGDLPM